MDTYAVSGGTPEASFFKSINLECSTFIFDRCGFYEPMEAFLRGFNCLTHLSIYLFNYSYEWDSVLRVKTYPDEYGTEDDYDDDLEKLSGVSSKLQVLQILPKDGCYKGREKGKFKLVVNYPNPVSSWLTFTQLRHVKTPYRAFEVKLRETAANTDYFTSKLQMLELTCAIINPDHRFFLEFVLENRSQCPDLKTIHLHTFTYWKIQNDDGPRKKLIESWGDIWEKLEAAGVSLIVFDDDEDRDSDDEDEDEYEEYEGTEDEDED